MHWEYAIDAGSEMLRMTTKAEIYREPAFAAKSKARGVFAWGERALSIYGREPEGVTVIKCVQGGVITDTSLMAKRIHALTGDVEKRVIKRPGVLLAAPATMRADVRDEFERRVIDEGIPAVGMTPSDVACALGANLPIMEPEACLIADVGAEKISASIISMGRVLKSDYLPFGMRRADERIISGLRTGFGYAIGPKTAKEIKHELGALSGMSGDVKTQKAVFDYSCMLPRMREIPASAVSGCVAEVAQALTEMLSRLLLFMPEEISADLIKNGVTLAGGGAQLFGLDLHLKKALNLPVKVAENPENCVINGLSIILKDQKAYQCLIEDEMEESRRP